MDVCSLISAFAGITKTGGDGRPELIAHTPAPAPCKIDFASRFPPRHSEAHIFSIDVHRMSDRVSIDIRGLLVDVGGFPVDVGGHGVDVR